MNKKYENAIHVAGKDKGLMIDIEVSPNSSESKVTGYNEWRKRITLKVRSPADKGKANAEVVEVLSRTFEMPESSIEIVSGHTSPQKTVVLYGLDVNALHAKLSKIL